MAQANKKSRAPKPKEKTWGQKLKAREPLNKFDEIKADADFNFKWRLREKQERERFEARKVGALEGGDLDADFFKDEESTVDLSNPDGDDDLSSLSRDELNQMAADLGVGGAENLPNRDAVIDAINEKGGN